MIQLSSYEKAILKGEMGEAKKFAMELIVKIGEIYQAKDLVQVSSAHILAHYGSLHDAGVEFYEKLVQLEARCVIPTTVDPSSLPVRWEEYRIPASYAQKQKRLCKATQKLGVIQNWSCTPYEFGNTPRFGEMVAWAESSAVVYANSVLGARTNRTPAGLDIAAAITGRMPRIGLYLDSNRVGKVLVEIAIPKLSDLDYHTIGYFIGKKVGTNIPVISGIPTTCSNYNLKCLGAAAASSGAVSMVHVLGITPEAKMMDPFNGKEPESVFKIAKKDLEIIQKEISTPCHFEADIVAIGCPHLSLEELRELCNNLRDKKIKKWIKFWIYTSQSVYTIAQQMGIIQQIEESGAEFQVGTCPVIAPLRYYGFKTMVTNSAKNANVVPSEHDLEVIYTDLATCIKMAVQ